MSGILFAMDGRHGLVMGAFMFAVLLPLTFVPEIWMPPAGKSSRLELAVRVALLAVALWLSGPLRLLSVLVGSFLAGITLATSWRRKG